MKSHLYRLFISNTSFLLRVVLILNAALFCSNVNGQLQSKSPLRFDHFSADHNLPQARVAAITQDKFGYMWFGTNNGLIKYDGYTFTTYQHDPFDKNSLPDNVVVNLFADQQGNIWYSSQDMTINRFDALTEKFTSFPRDEMNTYSDSTITASEITLAPDGKLWLASGDFGVSTYDPVTKKFHHPENLSAQVFCDDDVHSVMFDRKGLLWIATHTCLYNYDTKSKKLNFILGNEKNKTPFGILAEIKMHDRKGMIWIASIGAGVIRYDPKTGKTNFFTHIAGDSTSLSDNYVMSIFETDDGTIWLGGYSSGLSRYQPETNNFLTIHANSANPHGLGSENTLCIFQDRSGMLWIGTDGDGINTVNLKEKRFHVFQNYDVDYQSSHPMSLVRDHEGKIWMGTFHAGVQLFNADKGDFTSYLFSNLTGADMAFNNIFEVFEDSNDTLWFSGTFEGLHMFNRQTGRFTTVHSFRNNEDSTQFNITTNITEDKNKNLWLGTDHGLKCYNLKTKKYAAIEKLFSDTNDLSADGIADVYCDDDGLLWIGGQNSGITILNTITGKAKIFRHEEKNAYSLSLNSINCFYDDHKGKMYIGTDGGGLNIFDRKTEHFLCYTVSDGLPDNSIKAILGEEDGTLWVSTTNGICKILFRDCGEEKPVAVCRIYDSSDGLPAYEFKEQGAVKSNDGTFYFCNAAGLVAFKPDELKNNSFLPPTVITSLDVLNRTITANDSTGILNFPVDKTKQITLSYKQNVFSFTFAALNFVHPEKNKFAYMLEGFDKSWIYTNASKRFASYTNLNAGKYVFKVKGSNNDGLWNETPSTIQIIITPPFWQTWWFNVLAAAAIAAALYGVYRYRLQQVMKLQVIRNNIAADLHDDIGSTLNSISVLSEVAKQQAGKPLPALDEVGASSRKIVEAMSDIVWTINPENDTFEKIIIRMRSFAHQVLKGKKIEFRFHVEGDFSKLTLPMQARKNIYLIFKEATTNIAKYSNAGHVNFSVAQNDGHINLTIRDNGTGFDVAQVESGNGIKNMQRRAEEINARIKIESEMEKGTNIELNLKI